MADLFGDPSLFEEFDKEQLPCDNILRQKFKKDVLQNTSVDEGSDSAISGAEFQVGSDSGSGSESENDFIENEDSDHGGGITGVGDILHKLNNELVDSKPIGKDIAEIKAENGALDSERYLRMKKQIEDLIGENQRLRKQARLVNCDKIASEVGPVLQVVFTNHDIARKYKSEIEDFVQHLLENGAEEKIPAINLRPNSVCLKNQATETTSNCSAINSSHFYTDYMVDSMGWPLIAGNPALTDGWSVPRYEQVYRESLPGDGSMEEGLKPQARPRKGGSCFNCGGDHNLRECKEPHDQDRINQARRDMAENNGPKKQRYIQEEGGSNQSKFKAGEISAELREALGINSRQLPPFIYQMRLLGYPPGWLEEAEVYTSGMAMFDKHGKEMGAEEENLEDGELDLNGPPKKSYDKEKIVSYPGFNVTPSDDALDEHAELGMPPMQPHHQKEALELYMTPKETGTGSGKKRRRGSELTAGSSSKKSRFTPAAEDMDLDSQDSSFSEPTSRGSQSPTMDSLKAQHQLIQAQLAAMEGDNDSEVQVIDSCDELNDSFVPPVPPTPEAPPLPPGTPPVTPSTPGVAASSRQQSFKSPLTLAKEVTPSRIPLPTELSSQVSHDSGCVIASPVTPSNTGGDHGLLHRTPSSTGGGSVSSTSGTPVVLAKTPSSEGKGLPAASKFASGIMEHLPFENLPDSTGRYQQMKKVLEGVRSNRKKSS